MKIYGMWVWIGRKGRNKNQAAQNRVNKREDQDSPSAVQLEVGNLTGYKHLEL